MTTGLVIVVEDDPAVVDLLRLYLGRTGSACRRTATGSTALQAIRTPPPGRGACSTSACPGSTGSRSAGACAPTATAPRCCSSPPATTRSTACSASSWAPTTTSPSRSARASWSPGSTRSCDARSRATSERLRRSGRSTSTSPDGGPPSTGRPVHLTATEFDLLVHLLRSPGPGAQPRVAPRRGLGLRRCGRHAHGRRARGAGARQARPARADPDGARRGLRRRGGAVSDRGLSLTARITLLCVGVALVTALLSGLAAARYVAAEERTAATVSKADGDTTRRVLRVERAQRRAERRVTRAVLLAVGLSVAVGAVAGGATARILTRPLRQTADAARAMGAGRRDVRVAVEGPPEIAEVATSLNSLAEALATSEGRQRRFLLAVSHELRNPLTAVHGFAESVADGVVTGDEARAAGAVILAESGRLEHLVRDLLALARLGADDFRLDVATVDVAALLDDAARVWSSRASRIRVERPGVPLPVRTDAARLRQVLDGLADNAVRMTPPGPAGRPRGSAGGPARPRGHPRRPRGPRRRPRPDRGRSRRRLRARRPRCALPRRATGRCGHRAVARARTGRSARRHDHRGRGARGRGDASPSRSRTRRSVGSRRTQTGRLARTGRGTRSITPRPSYAGAAPPLYAPGLRGVGPAASG